MDDAVAMTRATHEAGHAVAGWLCGLEQYGATLEPERDIACGGLTRMAQPANRGDEARITIASLLAEDVGRGIGFLEPQEVVAAAEAVEAPQPERWSREWRRIDCARMTRGIHDDLERFEALVPQRERGTVIAAVRADITLYWPQIERVARALFDVVVLRGSEIHELLEGPLSALRSHVDDEAEPHLEESL